MNFSTTFKIEFWFFFCEDFLRIYYINIIRFLVKKIRDESQGNIHKANRSCKQVHKELVIMFHNFPKKCFIIIHEYGAHSQTLCERKKNYGFKLSYCFSSFLFSYSESLSVLQLVQRFSVTLKVWDIVDLTTLPLTPLILKVFCAYFGLG